MPKTSAYLGGLMSATALLVVGSLPASAASGDTVTTFSITGGSLSVAVQPSATLTNGGAGTTQISGQLGEVAVTDERGGVLNWTTSATSTTFARTGGGADSTSTDVSYNSGLVAPSGTVVATSSGPKSLTATPSAVVTGTLASGVNGATWNPALTVTLPVSALAGDYAGTVNTSVV